MRDVSSREEVALEWGLPGVAFWMQEQPGSSRALLSVLIWVSAN